MASAWSQLDQLLTCAICLDRYRNPKLLPCQHTFCMEPCLDGLIDYGRRQIKCPECRAEHRIPYKGIQEFPTNVTLMRFLELHRDITGEEPEPPPSMMERCSVCSEKANLEKCAHCDKKICPDCKEAHIDILRREINRINNQVRRGLHRLADALAQTKKNAEKLQLNCTQVKDEIEDIVRRYSKDLKHTEEKLKHDLEMYTEAELKAVNKLKEDLEAEVTNMSSNCDLVDKYIKDNSEWSDAELLEYKDIFIRTLDFLRSFDADSSDFSRRIKFQPRADPDVLHRNIADFGELKINAPPASAMPIHQQSLAPPTSNALMRSQSDHRLAAQFARRTETRPFADRYGEHTSDNERESGRPSSPLYGRSRRGVEGSGYRRFSERNRDYDYDRPNNRYLREENNSSSVLSSRWRDGDEFSHRSRYNRDFEDYDPEPQHTSRTVRFADDPPQRPRIFDIDSAAKGPLSGVIKLMDSPTVMERLHQHEVRQKQQTSDKDSTTVTPPQTKTETRSPTQPLPPIPPQRKAPTRELSEDEIDRQKKANQQASSSSSVTSPQNTTPESPSRPPTNKTETSKSPVPGRIPRKESTENSPAEVPPTNAESTTRSRKPPAAVEVAEESDSTTSSNSRCLRPGVGKALAPDGTESTPAQPSIDKKVPATATQLTALTTASDRRNENEVRVNDEVLRPVQSSFFSRQRRLPDPEPRLLQNRSSDEDDEEDDNDSEEESEEEDEEEEEEEGSEELGSNAKKTAEQPGAKPSTEVSMESESEESSTESSSSESESEDSDEKENENTNTTAILNQRSAAADPVDSNSNRLTSTPKHPPKDIDCKDERSDTTAVRNAGDDHDDNSKRRSRLQSDDFDATDSSSGSSSTNYHSLSNATPTILSNGTMEDNLSSENSIANSPHKESRFARKRPVLARSRSSHELGLGYEATENADDDEDEEEEEEEESSVLPSYRARSERASADEGRVSSRARPRFDHQTSVDSALSPTSSSWANYLKNKYGTNAAGRVVARSRSSHALFQRSDSESSDDELASGRDSILSGSMNYANPRSTYMQKRRMLFKFGSRGTEPGTFTWPRGVAVGPDDSIVVADSSNHRVQVFDSLGVFLFEFGSYGSCEGHFDCPSGVSVNRIGQYIVSDRYNQRVQLFDPAGRFLRAFGSEGRTDGRFSSPWGITTDSLGFIYVCDKENHRVQVFQSDGTFVGKFGSLGSRPGQLENPHYIAVSNTNRVVVSDSTNHRIQIFDVNGRTLSTFGSEGSSEGQFKFPRGVAVDDQGFIIVGDSGNNRIQIFHPDGSYLREFGTWGSGEREFKGLEGIAVTSAGNILVCDRENHRIQVF